MAYFQIYFKTQNYTHMKTGKNDSNRVENKRPVWCDYQIIIGNLFLRCRGGGKRRERRAAALFGGKRWKLSVVTGPENYKLTAL